MIARTLAVALAVSVASSGWLWWRLDAARDELAAVQAGIVSAALAYSENARQAEQQAAQRQKEITDAKDAHLRRVRAGLLADLDGLRNRPDRVPSTPDAPRTTCAGATGAELSGPDAGFLAREAARADELRQHLDACQQREHAGWPVSQP